ncbi:hypothetical protein [Corynebacterium marinum]|uniref:Uncharacterized protein n=1 Tax=Corynebacterium marinum DSM 44953 TaxID=1224162 RepID=A0A0B6TNB0_9CORY|nr:hypothetical protein [Corynebacterium marinum]AJK69373.1 hypothetical protein B840_08890 [Corynebacterium marinum DSM 44953]GGO21996.1 hypothetical protein GCM10010980_23660 [Corynebacterium marinum]
MNGEFPGQLSGHASATLALTALIYANLGDIDVAGEAARWHGAAAGQSGADTP